MPDMQPGDIWMGRPLEGSDVYHSLLEPEVAALLREIVQVNAAIVALNTAIVEALQPAKYLLQQPRSTTPSEGGNR